MFCVSFLSFTPHTPHTLTHPHTLALLTPLHSSHLKQIRVCSNPFIVDKTEYALRVAANVIQFYENRFNVVYPLPKQGVQSVCV